MSPIYVGVFLDAASIAKLLASAKALEIPVRNMHVTFMFRLSPELVEAFSRLDGTPVTITVVGRGSDANNSGVKVSLPADLRHLYRNSAVPHVTVYLSKSGKPVDTGKLAFEDIPPFQITGTIGMFYPSERL